ncbi:MAG TPA: CinA family protein [Anaerolineae bacterium]|nr:CinA family protein [Anaerolineae bacterium]
MTLEEQVGALLAERGLSLVTAESCTGGLVGHRLTNVSGSSSYYLGGFVTYSDHLKKQLLGVSPATLAEHGAVSEPTAREMVRGARERLGADLALAVTGVAGPEGGTPQKPVGLVYVALSSASAEVCHRHQFDGDRLAVKQQSAEVALRLLLAHLERGEDRMVEFLDEPVSVEVHVRPGGKSRPAAFSWQGRRYEITSWGREEDREQAGRALHCLLVQTAGPETWELCHEAEGGRWLVARRWPRRPPIA